MLQQPVSSSDAACWKTMPHLLGLHLSKETFKYPWCESCTGWQAARSGRHIPKHGVCLACTINMRQAGP